tara:strand:+ start:273 stop:1298 length:1026 start_codon:yes stop_codon:yes gene_type:complete
MANTFFKSFSEADRTTSRTLLHEAIPITGSIVSGTYNANSNIKSFSHAMYKSVYDYPYLSSSANHIFDVSFGYNVSSSFRNTANIQDTKKINMYTQMAQVLMGFDVDAAVKNFDADGNSSTAGDKLNECFFMNFSRLLVKDEIKKGSFSLTLGTGSVYTSPFAQTHVITDSTATSSYNINSPAGEFGILQRHDGEKVGLLYYQAGIAVLTSSVLGAYTATQLNVATEKRQAVLTGSNMDKMSDAFIHRILNVSFNNTTELNSTIYFCRANHNEFNYSSNPTYLTESKVVVKADDIMMPPRSYVTTVGLYSADNELLAVAKLSEPLRKDPSSEITLRVRLDY